MLSQDRIASLLERIAEGVEKMGADPVIEIEVGPPICPTCGKVNPKVNLPTTEGGWGRLAEILIEAQCECGAALYIAIESYSCHARRESAVTEVRARIKDEGWSGE